ncbi:anti-sigma factor [Algihabitans albus]|uniref:hypothetical protein n=1 Tax=Algihabitans albus TaxID=2164067 RepID=UPI000E5D615D|nr:hypothetical protein [Algihabitans albus]
MTGEQEFEIGGAAARQLLARSDRGRGAVERPGPVVLAAWLEGHLSETEAAEVEAWIAYAPEAAEDVALLREALKPDARDPLAAPAPLVSRAQAIVRAPLKARPEAGAWIEGLLGQPLLRWGAMAALALVVGVGGFEIGNQGLAPSLAPLQTSQVTVADFGAQPAPFL